MRGNGRKIHITVKNRHIYKTFPRAMDYLNNLGMDVCPKNALADLRGRQGRGPPRDPNSFNFVHFFLGGELAK